MNTILWGLGDTRNYEMIADTGTVEIQKEKKKYGSHWKEQQATFVNKFQWAWKQTEGRTLQQPSRM